MVPRHMVAFLLTTLSSDKTCFNSGSRTPRFNSSCLFSSPAAQELKDSYWLTELHSSKKQLEKLLQVNNFLNTRLRCTMPFKTMKLKKRQSANTVSIYDSQGVGGFPCWVTECYPSHMCPVGKEPLNLHFSAGL